MIETSPADLVYAARSFLGCPWHHGGRCLDGIDCIGLIVLSYAKVGVAVPDLAQYGQGDHFEQMCEHMDRSFDRVEDIQGGDVLLFRDRLMFNHSGIANGDGGMIHAYSGTFNRKVIEQPLDSRWDKRLQIVFRSKEICWRH